MNIEEIRIFCLHFPGVTEDIKWGNNLVFSVAGKLFCLADLDPPLSVSIKVPEASFDDLTQEDGIIQAPYFARRKWVMVTREECLSRAEWERLIGQSYALVKSGLSLKKQKELEM